MVHVGVVPGKGEGSNVQGQWGAVNTFIPFNITFNYLSGGTTSSLVHWEAVHPSLSIGLCLDLWLGEHEFWDRDGLG